MANALKRRGSVAIWLDPGMSWDAAPTGRRGRPRTRSDAVFQTGLSMKVLFGMVDIGAPLLRARMSAPRTTGRVESLLRLVGIDLTMPDFRTLSRRRKTSAASIP
jgi:hypothetical protein